MPELFSNEGIIFDPDKPAKTDGLEKDVYPVWKKGKLDALKIYRLSKEISPELRSVLVEQEYTTLLKLHRTALHPYLTEPHEMIYGKGGIPIGLLVSWESGYALTDPSHVAQIPNTELVKFKKALISLASGTWLTRDSLSDANIFFNPPGHIWLAEPIIDIYLHLREQLPKSWESFVNSTMERITRNYSDHSKD